MVTLKRCVLAACCGGLVTVLCGGAWSAEPESAAKNDKSAGKTESPQPENLANQQQKIGDRFKQFESLLLRLHEADRVLNPQGAQNSELRDPASEGAICRLAV